MFSCQILSAQDAIMRSMFCFVFLKIIRWKWDYMQYRVSVVKGIVTVALPCTANEFGDDGSV